jgi:predicted Zn finger-like uncharacterized protein
MRLTCPNCDAQYEVESRLIPDAGRDVQCSSCGDTWFQEAEQKGHLAADTILDVGILAQDSVQEPSAAEDEYLAPEPPEEPVQDPEDIDVDAPPHAAPERPSLASTVTSVLREEAERETQARIAEGSADLETQTDLGLQEPESEPNDEVPAPKEEGPAVDDAVRERTARLRGIEPEDVSDGSPSSRRDLLPDIEEINSTLRATSDRKSRETTVVAEEKPSGRGGFRTGFSLIIVLVSVLLLTYSFAAQIGQRVPALDPAMKTFVSTADAGRRQLDLLMESVISKINSDDVSE